MCELHLDTIPKLFLSIQPVSTTISSDSPMHATIEREAASVVVVVVASCRLSERSELGRDQKNSKLVLQRSIEFLCLASPSVFLFLSLLHLWEVVVVEVILVLPLQETGEVFDFPCLLHHF